MQSGISSEKSSLGIYPVGMFLAAAFLLLWVLLLLPCAVAQDMSTSGPIEDLPEIPGRPDFINLEEPYEDIDLDALLESIQLEQTAADIPSLETVEPFSAERVPVDLAVKESGGNAPASPLQARKEIFYLLARLGKYGAARPLGEFILKENPAEQETLLVFCSMELERRHAAGVRRYAKQFLEFYPEDHQGIYFMAAAESLEGNYAQALDILESLRARQFADRDFPYKVDLASSARLAGDWRTALVLYQELLADQQSAPALRSEARRILDEIYREHSPRIIAVSDYQNLLSTGAIFKNELAWESPLTNRMRLSVRLEQRDLSQEANGAARELTESYQQGEIGVEAHLASSWWLNASLGGSNAGLIAAAELRRRIAPTKSVFLGAEYNQIATDSLALQLLDGRENRVEMGWDTTVDPAMNWRVAGLAFARMVTVDSEVLGHGGGGEWQVERLLMRDPVIIRVAYNGQLSFFNTTSTNAALVQPLFAPLATPAQEEEALGNEGIVAGSPETLITPTINYHGLSFSLSRDILPRWRIEVIGLTGYYFDTSQLNYGGFVRNTFYPRKSIELQTNLGYLNSGLQSNIGSQVFQMTLSLQILF